MLGTANRLLGRRHLEERWNRLETWGDSFASNFLPPVIQESAEGRSIVTTS